MAASITDTVRLGAQTEFGANFRHGYASKAGKSSEYLSWRGAVSRCTKPHDKNYNKYGGRGIGVCDRWRHGEKDRSGFQCFIVDMGDKPSKKHSLDRINNDGDYSPENCKWSTHREQCNNRRSSKWITLDGETKTLVQWCRIYNHPRGRIHARLKAGWSVDDAFKKALVPSGLTRLKVGEIKSSC